MTNMKTILSLIALVGLSVSAAELTATLDLTGSAPSFYRSGTYDIVSLPSATMTTQPGAPMLPLLPVNVVIPQDMKLVGVRSDAATSEPIAGEFLLMPAQPPVTGMEPVAPAFVPPDPSIYGAATAWPAEPARTAGQNSMSGYNIACLLVSPLQYLPAERKLTFARSLTLHLEFEPADLEYLPVGIRSAATKLAIEDDLKTLVINPDDVSRFAPEEQ